MNEYLSKKIKVLSFVAIIMIVFLHTNLFVVTDGIMASFSGFMTSQITRVAVPLFFAISGYLFFRNCQSFNMFFLKTKVKKRVKSLMIPYLVWSSLGFLIVCFLQLVMPGSFSSYGSLSGYSLRQLAVALFWSPVGTYQLWFIRDLFICFLLSPLLYVALRYLREVFLLIFLFLFLKGYQRGISIESVFFVSLGAYCALFHQPAILYKSKSKLLVFILGITWMALCLSAAISREYSVHCLGVLAGLFFVWTLYDILYPVYDGGDKLEACLPYSFFIYVAHEPLLTLVKGMLLKFSISQLWLLGVYFLAPFITISICIVAGKLLNFYFPNGYSFLNGGR